MTKKRFKVVLDDSGYGQVWTVFSLKPLGDVEYRYAEFYGVHAKRYAYEHARRLNGEKNAKS